MKTEDTKPKPTDEEIAREARDEIRDYFDKPFYAGILGDEDEVFKSFVLSAMHKQGVAIALTRGRFAVVSPEDADLSLFDWYCTSNGRAARGKTEYMHQVIGERMGLSGEHDHIDGNPRPTGQAKMMNRLTLKWGSAKSWHLETDEAKAALQKWADGGVSMSAIMQKDSPKQKQALIDAIDLMDEIWLDWDGKNVSREEAKQYVLTYGLARQ